MVKYYHDWNSYLETWESDGRVFKELEPNLKYDGPLMEVFTLDFISFDGRDRTELRGTVTIVDDKGVHTIFSTDKFQTVGLGRFDALMGGDFSRGGRPIDSKYYVDIHTDLEDKTHGELVLMEPGIYGMLQRRGDNFKQRGPHHNEDMLWGSCDLSFVRTYDSLYKLQLVGPHCALDVLYAVFQDAVTVTIELTLMESKQDFHLDESVEVVRADVWGKVTARNTVLTDPETFSTLFARKDFDCASVVLGDSIPLSKPSVVLPGTSSLLLDLDLEYHVQSRHNSYQNLLKTKSSFHVPAIQASEWFVDIISPDVDGSIAMLKVKVK